MAEALEDHKELSALAAERVTWEHASAYMSDRAHAAFMNRDDRRATELRDIALVFDENAKKAGKLQQEKLKEMGRR